MQTRDALQSGRLAVLEGAVLALLRGALEDGFDGVLIDATVTEGVTAIDVQYIAGGVPLAGESL